MTWDFGSPRKIKNGDNFSISENENNIIIKAGQSAYEHKWIFNYI